VTELTQGLVGLPSLRAVSIVRIRVAKKPRRLLVKSQHVSHCRNGSVHLVGGVPAQRIPISPCHDWRPWPPMFAH